MDNNSRKQISSSFISTSARDTSKAYQRENFILRRQKENGFFSRSFDIRDLVFLPKEYEGIFLGLYILSIPYLAGLLFLFLFIAKASYEYFLEFNLASFFIIWAIGYEVCAVLAIVGIFLAWLSHINSRWNKEQARKKPPRDRYGF